MLKNRSKNRFRGYLGIIVFTLIACLGLKAFVLDAFCVPSASMESTLLPGDYIFVNKLIYGAKLPKRIPFSHAAFPIFRFPQLKSIAHGDVIVFELPNIDNSSVEPMYYVKRVIGIAGDTIAIHGGNILINGNVFRLSPITVISKDEEFSPVLIPKRGAIITITNENYSTWEKLIRQEGHTFERSSLNNIFIDGKQAASYTIEKNYLFVLGDNINHSSDSRSWGFVPEDNVIGQVMVVYWSAASEKFSLNPANLFSSIRWDRIGTFVH
jgi:signal peptidase I